MLPVPRMSILSTNTCCMRSELGARLFRYGFAIALAATWPLCGCNSFRNGWLNPTDLGNFEESTTSEIRTSLTLEDMPSDIPGATPPTPADLQVLPVEPEISAGDSLAVEIFELRQPLVPYQAQLAVSATGFVNFPVLGRLPAIGMTTSDFERSIVKSLHDREILIDPEVTVNPVFLQGATYSIFGVGVSASHVAPLRAGTFPIRRPDLRMLEAINQVGGLNEFVEQIYVFRYNEPETGDALRRSNGVGDARWGGSDGSNLALPGETPRRDQQVRSNNAAPVTPADELIAAVTRPGGGIERSQPTELRAPPVRPRSTDPYIWIGDEFVPNPAHKPSALESLRPTTPPGDAPVRTVDWARVAGDVSYRVLSIPADLLRSGDPQVNIVIRPGDVIRIVSGEIGVYYVMGQVNRVGTFAFNSEQVTLKSAIASAGGLAGLAWPSRCTVYRRLGQREQMIQVDLDRIFAGKDADFLIRRSDIINVGTHPFAPFLQRIRAFTLPNPLATVGYSFTYSRNFADIDSFSARINPDNRVNTVPGLFP